MRRVLFWLLVVVSSLLTAFQMAQADTFGSGENSFEIEFVRIGSPGNAPDDVPNPAGAVNYEYRIGKYEISEQMIDMANAVGGLGITKDTRGPDQPATSISWFEAARFVNWLNTSTGHTPAYKFDDTGAFQLWEPTDVGYDASNLYRNKLATYFLPSVDEWHKAAYYDPVAGHYWDYPTGSDAIPDGIDFVGDPDFEAVFYDGAVNPGPNDTTNTGVFSPYGTAGQGGNVVEWHETAFDRINSSPSEQRSDPGGSWGGPFSAFAASNSGIGVGPLFEGSFGGFRVASTIPEPSSAVLLIVFFATHALRMRARYLLW